MDFLYSIVGFFASGGVFMYPIVLVFAFGVAIAVERYITLSMVTNKNRIVWEKVQPLLTEGHFDEARQMTSEDESTISQVLNMGLTLQGTVRRREDIEIAMEESMMEIVPRLEKRTPYVALASSIATLLGLLGTIMGLIQAFTAVANANPAEKADLLSASISVAMNTTAFGLMVAIPLLITAVFSRLTIVELNLPSTTGGPTTANEGFTPEVIVREAGIEITNGRQVIATIPNKDDEFDLQTLSDYMVELKSTYPQQESASVLMEAQIPYDYLIRVMDTVRAVEMPIDNGDDIEFDDGEAQYELVALFTDISVGDAP